MKNKSMTCNCGSGLFVTARVLIIILFAVDLFTKLFNYSGTVGFIGSSWVPFPGLAYVIAIVLLLGGVVSILFDYKLAWGVGMLTLFLLGVNFMFHLGWSDQMQMITFLKNITMIGGLFALLAYKYKEPHKHH